MHRRNLILGLGTSAVLASIPLSRTTIGAELRDIVDPYREAIDPHRPPYNAKGDAVRGRDGTTDGTSRLAVPGYNFVAADIGKPVWVDVAGSAPRTIIAVGGTGDPNSCTVSGRVLPAGSGRGYLFGTDDTLALQMALDAAQYTERGAFVGAATQTMRADVRGRAVKLRSGSGYIVSNSRARFNAGFTAALIQHRRTALVGEVSYAQSELILAPGSYGDIWSNEQARAAIADNTSPAYCDFMTVANLTGYGCRGLGNPNAKSGFVLYPAFNGYMDTDPQNAIHNVGAFGCTEHGFYLGGRGELLASKLRGTDNGCYGLYLNALVDSSISQSSFGGNGKTAVRVNRSQSIRLVDIKGWYAGKTGGSDYKDSAAFVFEADQASNGKLICIALDAQETRGSSFVFDNSGYNILRGCRAQDPGQQNGLDSGTLPDVRVGAHLMNAGARENSLDIRVEPGVREFGNSNFTGSGALYIDARATGNYGAIETQQNIAYTGRSGVKDGAKLTGPGVANGANTRLRVDGVALT